METTTVIDLVSVLTVSAHSRVTVKEDILETELCVKVFKLYGTHYMYSSLFYFAVVCDCGMNKGPVSYLNYFHAISSYVPFLALFV